MELLHHYYSGSGTNPVKLSEVTERVMAVVGENSPNIVGLGSGLDSTILQMQRYFIY